MIILVGESGCGKSSIQKELCENYGYNRIVTYTTRPPRDGEVNGVDYSFVTDEEFDEMDNSGSFAETSEYNGWKYGSVFYGYFNKNSVAVLTPAGMREVKHMLKHSRNVHIKPTIIYIAVPQRDRLIKTLQRGDNIVEACRRSFSDLGQFDGVRKEVDYIIENAGYSHTVKELANICKEFDK